MGTPPSSGPPRTWRPVAEHSPQQWIAVISREALLKRASTKCKCGSETTGLNTQDSSQLSCVGGRVGASGNHSLLCITSLEDSSISNVSSHDQACRTPVQGSWQVTHTVPAQLQPGLRIPTGGWLCGQELLHSKTLLNLLRSLSLQPPADPPEPEGIGLCPSVHWVHRVPEVVPGWSALLVTLP